MDTVVITHGLWMTGVELYLLRKRLTAVGFRTFQFSYRSRTESLDKNCERLAAFLKNVPGDRIHLVGHSLGGVLILNLLERYQSVRVGRAVCLAPPLKGSIAARALAFSFVGNYLFGSSVAYFVREKGVVPCSAHQRVGVIAGDLPLGLGRFVGDVPYPNDGTIAVKETELQGIKDHIVLHVSHFSVLVSRTAANQVLHFLRFGSFFREPLDSLTN